jgi:small-conductance mechanosensitive channel
VFIGLLAVRLRTFDNVLVRIPNEQLLQSEIRTLTHFPIRRLDIPLSVSYEADLAEVRRAFDTVVESNPLCLQQPPAVLHTLSFDEQGVKVQLSVWCAVENVLQVKVELGEQMLMALKEAKIPVPYPRQVLEMRSSD